MYIHPIRKIRNPTLYFFKKLKKKKPEFVMEVEKNKLGYSFKRIDPFPYAWTHSNMFFLYTVKDRAGLYNVIDKDALHLQQQSYRVCKLVYNEKHKTLTNEISYYAGKKDKDLKLYGSSFIHFDLISDKIYKDKLDLLPINVTKKFTKQYLDKSLKILQNEPKKRTEEFNFSKRAFNHQKIFSSYDRYDPVLIAKELFDLKYYVLNDELSFSENKWFFEYFEAFYAIYLKITKSKNVQKSLSDIVVKLAYQKDKKKNQNNLYKMLKLIEDYWKSNN